MITVTTHSLQEQEILVFSIRSMQKNVLLKYGKKKMEIVKVSLIH